MYPIGEEIVIQGTDSEGVPDGDALRCVVTDKVYDNPCNFGKNSEANPIQKQVSRLQGKAMCDRERERRRR